MAVSWPGMRREARHPGRVLRRSQADGVDTGSLDAVKLNPYDAMATWFVERMDAFLTVDPEEAPGSQVRALDGKMRGDCSRPVEVRAGVLRFGPWPRTLANC